MKRFGQHPWFIVVICMATLLSAKCFAESKTYPSLKTISDPKKIRTLQSEAFSAIQSGASSANQKKIANFFVPCVINAMTSQQALAKASRFPEYRKVLKLGLKRAGNDAAMRNFLIKLYVRYLTPIVATKDFKPSQYSPAARYNAMLMLGQLDDRELQKLSGGKLKAPTPNAQVRKFMLGYLQANKPDAVYIAGLISLKRHLAIMMVDATQRDRGELKTIAELTTKLAATKELDSVSNDGLMWIRILSLECIGLMKSGSFGELAVSIATDETEPLPLRCVAVRTIGQLNFKDAKKVEADKVLASLRKMVHYVCTEEISRVNRKIKSGGQRFYEGSENTDLFSKQDGPSANTIVVDPIVQEIRRQLLAQLGCIRQATRSKTLPKNNTEKAQFEKTKTQIEELIKMLTDAARTMEPEELLATLESNVTKFSPN